MALDTKGLSYLNWGRDFKQLAQAIPDLVFLLDPADFKIRFVNHLPSRLKTEEVIGTDITLYVCSDDADLLRGFLTEIASSGKTRDLELENRVTFQDTKGKTWHICTASVLEDAAGKTESLLLILKDITATKQHDIDIHNKEEKLYAILNNTSDIILSIDRGYNLTEYNSVFASMIEKGFGKKELNGTSVLDYLDPKKHEDLKKLYLKVFQGEVANVIDSFETISGLTVYNETSYHPIYNFEHEVTGISIFSKNITERVLGDQKLKNTLKEREVLLAEIHHRIKNNLALVSSMLQLKEMNMENEAAREALSDSRKRIKSTALVHEMLYRNDTFDRVQMHEYLGELFNNLNVSPDITLELSGENPVFDLNRALPFGLMMHELMMNSFKHSFRKKDKVKLKLSSTLSQGILSIHYADCTGIFPDEVNFNDTSSTGLMLIHTFIEQLNGSIELISKEPPQYQIQIPMA